MKCSNIMGMCGLSLDERKPRVSCGWPWVPPPQSHHHFSSENFDSSGYQYCYIGSLNR